MPKEEWREIPGYPGYDASNLGRVRSWHNRGWIGHGLDDAPPLIMKARLIGPKSNQRYAVKVFNNGIPKREKVSRLVLWAFVGPCPLGMECCHEDDNPTNDTIGNLRWDTKQGNFADRRRNGNNDNRGSGNGRARIREEDALAIRQDFAAGQTQAELADRFSVTVSLISAVTCGLTWKHVGGPINNRLGRPMPLAVA